MRVHNELPSGKLLGQRLAGVLLFLALFPGCVAFNLRVRTVVDHRTACLRQIDYSGSSWERFLIPEGGPWEVTRTDSGVSARAMFKDPNLIGTDIVFDASQQVADNAWLEFAKARHIAQPKAQALRFANRVTFRKTYLLVMYRYRYREEWHANSVPDFLRYHYLEKRFPTTSTADSVELAREALRLAARAFADCRLTCAVLLPGTISSTNADWVEGQTALWEVSPLEFREGATAKVMEVTSHRYLWTNIAILCLAVLAGMARLIMIAVRSLQERRRDPLWRLHS
ncbi:MAG: hypothetical protein ONB30_05360 [candidate division KSB1 bacterium]|nr:hypothetical protein [candidate division KSB1 bacterium]